MKNKKIITLIAVLGLITCSYTKVDAVKFYDTIGTRYEGAAERLGELNIVQGVSNKTFEADRTITRAEFAKMIVEASLTQQEINMLSEDKWVNKFKDVSENAWYYKYVIIATNYNYINGYKDNTFRPDKEITYEEVSKILMKALGHNYLVETDPRGWSAEYMDKMYDLRINQGTTSFKKTDNATRGNIAIMIWNTLKSDIWERVYLNDTLGFTYMSSGRTLFDKKVNSYIFRDGFIIKGFKEINDELYVELSDGYYQLYDQDAVVTFSMIGGKAEGLFKYMRYPQDEYRYELIGLSSDTGAQLFSGTFEQLKEDGIPFGVPTERIGSNTNYGFYIKNGFDDRMVTVNSENNRFYVNKIEIKTNKKDVEKDDEETIKKINATKNNYEYVEDDQTVTKTITLNESEEIQDGAVLFRNNKRVKWDSVKVGDIITEIEKDKYYFVSSETIEATIEDYTKDSEGIEFITSEGMLKTYKNARVVEYFSENNKTTYLNKYTTAKLNELKGLKVRFYLDFAGNVDRLELLENYKDDDESLTDLGIGFFNNINYSKDGNTYITLNINKKDREYETSLKSAKANLGDLVVVKFGERSIITDLKVVSTTGIDVNNKLTLKKISYDDLNKKIEREQYAANIPIYQAKYYYDFGEYNKIVDYDVEKINLEDIELFDKDTTEFYALSDDDTLIRMILVKDFSEKKDIFYGKVEKIFSEDDKIKITIDILEHKKLTYVVSGLLNCEEGNIVSFKMIDKERVEIVEKYAPKALGYYKDIIVKEITKKEVISENGEIDLEKAIITDNLGEYMMSKFNIILINVKKDEEGQWILGKTSLCNLKDLELKPNDRIAINEIEDTIIVYRGYKE